MLEHKSGNISEMH